MNRFFISFILLFFALSSSLLGQIKIHKTFSSSDGLVQSQISDILQDSYGYIWFATMGGVSRWDGVNFENFTTKNGLSATQVLDMVEGTDSTMYFCTFGKGITTFKNNKFDTLTTNDGLLSNFVSRVFIHNNQIYAVSGGDLQLYQKHHFVNFGKELGIPTLPISDIIFSDNGEIILGTFSGIYFYNNGLQKHYTSKDGLNSNYVTRILIDDKNNIIVGTDKGPNKITNGIVSTVYFNNKPINAFIQDVYGTDNNEIFYASAKGVYKEKNNKVTLIDDQNGLTNNVTWKIFEDKNHLLYFGSNGFGFSIYENEKIINYKDFPGISSNIITSIMQSKNGYFIISTPKSVFYFNPIKNKIIKHFPNLATGSIYTVNEFLDDQVFITTEQGYIKINKNKKSKFLVENSGLLSRVHCAVESFNNNIYFGTPNGIVILSNNKTTRLTKKDGLPSNYILSLYFTKDSTLLIGTHGQGMSFYKNGKFNNISKKDGLSNGTVQCFLERQDKSIWVGTNNGGINILKNNTIFTVSSENGLLSDNIIALNEDSNERIYVTTHKGINIIEFIENSMKIRSITENDGLISNDCSPNATIVDKNGNVWIGTSSGLSKYNPNYDNPIKSPPPIYITGFEIFNISQNLQEFNKNPSLTYDQNYLKFIYSGINISSPLKTMYQYRLSGVDKNWVTSKVNNVQYTNLRDGEYIFEVKARNEWGYWSKPVSLAFIIAPAWYNTWWFYSLIIIAVGSLISFAASYRYRNLLAVEKIRTKISADLHDSIGSGLSEITILSELLISQPNPNVNDLQKGLKNISVTARSLVGNMSDIV